MVPTGAAWRARPTDFRTGLIRLARTTRRGYRAARIADGGRDKGSRTRGPAPVARAFMILEEACTMATQAPPGWHNARPGTAPNAVPTRRFARPAGPSAGALASRHGLSASAVPPARTHGRCRAWGGAGGWWCGGGAGQRHRPSAPCWSCRTARGGPTAGGSRACTSRPGAATGQGITAPATRTGSLPRGREGEAPHGRRCQGNTEARGRFQMS